MYMTGSISQDAWTGLEENKCKERSEQFAIQKYYEQNNLPRTKQNALVKMNRTRCIIEYAYKA